MIAERRSLKAKNKLALVIGVNGQDGSYLAQHLHLRNWTIFGIGRHSSARREVSNYLATYRQIDIVDTTAFQRCLTELRPDAIFHTAAIHGPSGFKYEDVWLDAYRVNTISLHATLEYARLENKNAQVVYLSSAKVFGDLHGKTITEATPRTSECIYSITKNAAESAISYYRDNYGINASVLWMFNHESERRTHEYFIMKIISALKNCLTDKTHKTNVRSLDFWCDWGSASEYMEILTKSCDFLGGDDYILATGKTVWARDVVREFFFRHGLASEDHIRTDIPIMKKPTDFWSASNEKFKRATGFSPTISGIEVFENVLSKI